MAEGHTIDSLDLGTPATYRILVKGHLADNWSDRLGGLAISRSNAEGVTPVTILVGHLADQASLSGVLNALYNLRMPLISVETLDEDK